MHTNVKPIENDQKRFDIDDADDIHTKSVKRVILLINLILHENI